MKNKTRQSLNVLLCFILLFKLRIDSKNLFIGTIGIAYTLESVQYFLIELDMKPCMCLVEISIFFTKSCHRQTYQNYEQPPQTSQNLYF